MSNNNDPFADFTVISSYTTEDAINDGVLVHFEAISPGKWCVTQGVMAAIEDNAGEGRTHAQSLHNMMSDVLAFVQAHKAEVIKQAEGGVPLFTAEFDRWMAGNVTRKTLWLGSNETGGFTVMFPEER